MSPLAVIEPEVPEVARELLSLMEQHPSVPIYQLTRKVGRDPSQPQRWCNKYPGWREHYEALKDERGIPTQGVTGRPPSETTDRDFDEAMRAYEELGMEGSFSLKAACRVASDRVGHRIPASTIQGRIDTNDACGRRFQHLERSLLLTIEDRVAEMSLYDDSVKLGELLKVLERRWPEKYAEWRFSQAQLKVSGQVQHVMAHIQGTLEDVPERLQARPGQLDAAPEVLEPPKRLQKKFLNREMWKQGSGTV